MSDPILDSFHEGPSSFLLRKRWSLEEEGPADGPTMTVSGTLNKLALLLVCFAVGFFVSWHHFHAYSPHMAPMDKLHVAMWEMPAWQRGGFYALVRYPYYALFLFFLFFIGCGVTRKGLMIVAPLCVAVQGVSCGAFEYVLQDRYPGVTLLCGGLVVGMFLGLLLLYMLGLADTDNVPTLTLVGAGAGLVFLYVATMVIRSFAVDVPYLHQGPANWGWVTLGILTVGSGSLAFSFARVVRAAHAGTPKWVEWRAAVSLIACFVLVLQLLRRVLINRSVGRLVWDYYQGVVNEARSR